MKLNKNIDLELEIDLKEIAKELAKADNSDQANFFDDFKSGLDACCQDAHHVDIQICDIADKLGKEGKELIASLYDFININNQPNG